MKVSVAGRLDFSQGLAIFLPTTLVIAKTIKQLVTAVIAVIIVPPIGPKLSPLTSATNIKGVNMSGRNVAKRKKLTGPKTRPSAIQDFRDSSQTLVQNKNAIVRAVKRIANSIKNTALTCFA